MTSRIFPLEEVHHSLAFCHHFQETPSGAIVLEVLLEMLRKSLNFVRK